MPTTTTTYNLRAITDESITKIHLGAVEKANVTFCGVKLLVAGDTRFGGKYAKGNGYTSSTDLGTVDCGACKRTSAWRIFAGTGSATIGIPAHAASKPKAAPEAAPATEAKPPSTRKRPSAATRAAAKAAAEAVSGSSVIEADPETGLPRIKPEYAAKAEQVAADQAARNAG
ncbi:MAG: hypothetical protein ACLPKI_05200 [Streptosporangiaceae bacterium]